MIHWGPGEANDNSSFDDCGEPRACRVQDDVTPGAARGEDRAKQDDAKCRDFGSQPQADTYGKYRLKLERLRLGSELVRVLSCPATVQSSCGVSDTCESRGSAEPHRHPCFAQKITDAIPHALAGTG
jgi:hypothetical protein